MPFSLFESQVALLQFEMEIKSFYFGVNILKYISAYT